jgi:hypothetical protein
MQTDVEYRTSTHIPPGSRRISPAYAQVRGLKALWIMEYSILFVIMESVPGWLRAGLAGPPGL